MPTYINETGKARVVDFSGAAPTVMIGNGETVALDFYAPPSARLTLVSDDPSVRSPILLSVEATDETVEIPFSRLVTISVLGVSGATAYFAGDTEGVAVPDGGAFVMTGAWSRLAKVKVEGTAKIVAEEAR